MISYGQHTVALNNGGGKPEGREKEQSRNQTFHLELRQPQDTYGIDRDRVFTLNNGDDTDSAGQNPRLHAQKQYPAGNLLKGGKKKEGDSRKQGVNRKMSESKGTSFDKDQVAELREIFASFDRNNDGSITELELGSLLRSLDLKPSREQLEALIQKADTNSNGLIEFSEFVALVAPEAVPESPYTEGQLRAIFRVFDRDGDGYVTAAELAHSMARLGHALTVEELTGMIREADADGDGRISFSEFANAITSAAFDNAWA